ncbi:unnamed protein product, partial [Hapterophycus canaliculatus]
CIQIWGFPWKRPKWKIKIVCGATMAVGVLLRLEAACFPRSMKLLFCDPAERRCSSTRTSATYRTRDPSHTGDGFSALGSWSTVWPSSVFVVVDLWICFDVSAKTRILIVDGVFR